MTTDARYFLVRAGVRYGPYGLRELVRHESDGRVSRLDRLVRESDGAETNWGTLRETLSGPVSAPPTVRAIAESEPAPNAVRNRTLEVALPVNVNPLALIAGYLGLISLIMFVTGPLAIGLGVFAIRTLRKDQAGMFRATVGIIGGTIGTLLGVALLVFTLLIG
ncbi:MAG: DUF4190 domain-containing protein [Phycisphaerae bacterium]|nr:DUF4190 domain-containing protein [Phycisphaerae bacterium]